MRIQRVETRAFAVLERIEAREQGKLRSGEKLRKLAEPVAKFGVRRTLQRGVVESRFEEITTTFYVNLTTGEWLRVEESQLRRLETLKKLLQLSEEAVRTLGTIYMRGEVLKEEISPSTFAELAEGGLIKVFRPLPKVVLTTVLDELLIPEKPTVVRERVKASFKLPAFDDPGWDLGKSFVEVHELPEDYELERIKYSLDAIANTLEHFYEAKAELQALIYLPKLKMERERVGKLEVLGEVFPLCPITALEKEKLKEGKRLKPIALATEIGVKAAIPVEEEVITFDDVIDLEDAKLEVKEAIVWPLQRPELAKEYEREAGGAILLYGPPGCGKTYLARAIIGECGLPFINVMLSDVLRRGVDAAVKHIHEVFEEAKRLAPVVVFFDEFDALARKRLAEEAADAVRIVDQFLIELDGVESMRTNVLILAATNAPWLIDPALRRSVRFTRQLFVPPPAKETRKGLFEMYSRGLPLASDVDFERLAELTEGYASSDIKAICERAAEIPWREALEGKPKRKVEMSDFLSAVQQQKSSLLPWFKRVRAELKEEELEVFPELARDLLDFERVGERLLTKAAVKAELEKFQKELRAELKELEEKKAEIELEVKVLKEKLEKGEIDERSYRELLEGVERELIRVEARLRLLKAGSSA